MFSIAQVLQHFKQQWTTQLDDQAIEHACREAGVVWRDRVLPPVYVIKLSLLQILHGNTACHHCPCRAVAAIVACEPQSFRIEFFSLEFLSALGVSWCLHTHETP